jgi:hypothetical protein
LQAFVGMPRIISGSPEVTLTLVHMVRINDTKWCKNGKTDVSPGAAGWSVDRWFQILNFELRA